MALTNPSQSAAETLKKYLNSEIVSASTSDQTEAPASTTPSLANRVLSGIGRFIGVPLGAMPVKRTAASVQINSMSNTQPLSDLRVKIRVPDDYLTALTQGPSGELRNLKGIIFPYTPSISIEQKADYASQTPIHSNYAIYFYQRSSVSPITISGKFTVSNDTEAAIYISTLHLLRSLTKMRFGGETGDSDSGAPPPVCRLDAYGSFMLDNVPVAISAFKIDLPENVDYFTVGKRAGTPTNTLYDMTSVPIVSTISVTCIPMYSRDEMQKFSVTGWLGDQNVRKAGYL